MLMLCEFHSVYILVVMCAHSDAYVCVFRF